VKVGNKRILYFVFFYFCISPSNAEAVVGEVGKSSRPIPFDCLLSQ